MSQQKRDFVNTVSAAVMPFIAAVTLLVICLWFLTQPTQFVETAAAEVDAGPFAAQVGMGDLEDTVSLAVGDFNGDGRLDVVAGNIGPDPSMLYLRHPQNGREFLPGKPIAANGTPAAGDMNNDGILDLVFNNAIYLNDGAGNFTLQEALPGEGAPILIDFQGDGYLDIVSSSPTAGLYLHFNNGDGTYDTQDYTAIFTATLAVGDITGDSRPDLIIGDYVYHNNGVGTFLFDGYISSYGDAIELADVNGDGELDILVGLREAYNEVYFNDGAGHFPFYPDNTFGEAKDATTGIDVADLNGDGSLDIITSNDNGQQNKIFYNSGVGYFGELGVLFGGENDSTDVQLADMDGNGLLDAVVSNSGRPNFVYFSDEGGGFQYQEAFGSYNSSYDVAVGDINLDGQLDIVAGNLFQNSIHLNDNGLFSESYFGSTALSYDVALADLNGDGRLEILSGNDGVNEIYDYQSDTTTTFGANNTTVQLATGDLNNDNALDIVVGNFGVNEIYLNDGAGNIPATPSAVFGGGSSYGIALGDLNDDGLLDIVTGNYASNDYIYFNKGNNDWSEAVPFGGIYQTVGVATGDVDGDGDLDIVSGNDNQQYFVYFNDGLGNFEQFKAFSDPDLTSDIVLGDLDNDGDLDVASANLERVNFAYLNDGAGTFGQGIPLGGKANSWGIAMGDLDGDGYLDVVEGNTDDVNYIHYNGFRSTSGRGNNAAVLSVSRPVQTGDASFLSSPEILEDQFIPISFTITDPENDPVGHVQAFYSLDGGDNWQPAAPAAISDTINLATSFSNEANVFEDVFGNTVSQIPLSFDAADAANKVIDLEVETVIAHSGEGVLSAALVSDWPTAGTTVKLFENIAVTELGTSNITFRDNANRLIEEVTQAPGIQTYASTDITKTIAPDSPNSIISTITVAGGPAELLDVNVTNLVGTHTYIGDLVFTLESPSGTVVNLVANQCSSEDNFNFGFDDEAFWDFLDCPPTFGISYQPEEPLSLFDGEDSNGTWILYVDDTASGDGGVLESWSLELTGAQPLTSGAYASTDIPQAIGAAAPGGVTSSTLTIAGGPTGIANLEVVDLFGTHTWVSDLTFVLESPSGTQVTLLNGACGDQDDFFLSFADTAGSYPSCPLTGGFTYLPYDSLSAFQGEDSNGTWTLWIYDNFVGSDDGQLLGWGLNINPVSPLGGAYQPLEPLSILSGAPADASFTLVMTNTGNVSFAETLDRWQLRSIGREHVYVWDTFASGLFGRSDNVVLRLEAYSQLPQGYAATADTFSYPDSSGGDFQWPFASATTFPFTVRGTQIRVLQEGLPVEGAFVYRLPGGQTTGAQPIASANSGLPYRTNADGYLQGRGQVNQGDRLVAMVPVDTGDLVTFTQKYTLYHTSAAISSTINAPEMYTLNSFGVQPLHISAENALTLYDLDVSLEWDARNDPAYIDELTQNIQRASEILYDVSNGQVALGDVRIHHNKENWNYADVVILAANDVRPSANAGGIVISPTNDIISASSVISDAYLPGQVRMGPTWSRFGDPDSDLGEDWSRAFAHELGHFLFFLTDNYIGMDEQGNIIPTDCVGSFMTDIYNEDYSEFLEESGWVGECLNTIAEKITGRNDWETVNQYWPWLEPVPLTGGPNILPFGFTNVTQVNGDQPSATLSAPFFSLRNPSGNPIPVRDGQGRGYIFKNQETATLTDDYLIDVGTPRGDQMQARGVAPGDRLCIYDFTAATMSLGCLTVGDVEGTVVMEPLPGWNPQVLVSAQSSVTLAITVTQATSLPLKVQVLPSAGLTDTFPILSTVADLTAVSGQPDTYAQVVTLPYPAANGHVRVWAEGADPIQEVVTSFQLGEGFDANRSGFNANRSGFNANRSGFNANRSGFNAPIASGDGSVKIYNVEDVFADTGTLSLQALNEIPTLPSWLSPVGKAYRFESSKYFPRTIAFEYLQTAVPQGTTFEHTLRVYYSPDNGQTWVRLDSEVDIGHNFATAAMPITQEGEGIYVLAATIEMPALELGWNLFAYPIPFTRTLPLAVDSLGTSYTSIYQLKGGEWSLYDRTVSAAFKDYVNDLQMMEFGHAYWIYATAPVTPYIGLPENQTPPDVSTLPPATYYGRLLTGAGFNPTAGMTVRALINNQVCGSAEVENWNSQLVYKVQVAADNGDGCGVKDKPITFTVDGVEMYDQLGWNNRQANYHDLSITSTFVNVAYLPIINGGSATETLAPDLVVKSIVVDQRGIEVMITNQGTAAVAHDNAFWVDLYVDPSRTPTANDIWEFLSEEGAVWGVDAAALPLAPGESLLLTLEGAYFVDALSNYSGLPPSDTPIFVQVDSAHAGTTYGAVLETHEIDNTAYNNIYVVVYDP